MPRGESTGAERYAKKLADPRWQMHRLRVFQRDILPGEEIPRCRACGNNKEQLECAHIRYTAADPWDEPLENLITLCHTCHRFANGISADDLWAALRYVQVWAVMYGRSDYASDEWAIGLTYGEEVFNIRIEAMAKDGDPEADEKTEPDWQAVAEDAAVRAGDAQREKNREAQREADNEDMDDSDGGYEPEPVDPMADMHNRERARLGLPALSNSEALAEAERLNAANVRNGFTRLSDILGGRK